ncbi:MAG: hypothetical protein ACWA47_10695 [Brevirhabdus sp.]
MVTFVKRALVGAFFVGASAIQAVADVQLIMIEETGCFWCARWEREIGPIYPKTVEGRIAPLHKVEIHTSEVKQFDLKSPPTYTPTFILVNDGREVGRLEGYPGDEFFWTMIQNLIELLPAEQKVDPAS